MAQDFHDWLFSMQAGALLRGSYLDPNINFYGKQKGYLNSVLEAGYNFTDITVSTLMEEEPVLIPLYPNEIDTPYSAMRWQSVLRAYAFINQKSTCICGLKLDTYCQLHHALITRNDVKALDEDLSFLIHCGFNVILLHSECHVPITREKSVKYLSALYTRDYVKEWYDRTVEVLFPNTGLRNLFYG